jgi:hypothetical protein
MCLKAVEEASGSSIVIWVDLEPGVNQGTLSQAQTVPW